MNKSKEQQFKVESEGYNSSNNAFPMMIGSGEKSNFNPNDVILAESSDSSGIDYPVQHTEKTPSKKEVKFAN